MDADSRMAALGGEVDAGQLLPVEQEVQHALHYAGYDFLVAAVDWATPTVTLYEAYLAYLEGQDPEVRRNLGCRTLSDREFGAALNYAFQIPDQLHELWRRMVNREIEHIQGLRRLITTGPFYRGRHMVDGVQRIVVPCMVGPGMSRIYRSAGRPIDTEKPPRPVPTPPMLDETERERELRAARDVARIAAWKHRAEDWERRSQQRDQRKAKRQIAEGAGHAANKKILSSRPTRIITGKPRG